MTGAAFHKPATVEEAVALLADAGERGRALSGGATLVALINAGLVQPECLVSLAGIAELRRFDRLPDGTARIGAMRRHRQTAQESDLRDGQTVVSLAAAQIANPPVRNMGTIGGSIAFADPAADYPPALVAADAAIEIAGPGGRRTVPAEDFFLGWYETALGPGELVSAVLLPPAAAGSVGHYAKLCRVAGDFAIASVAIAVAVEAGAVSRLRLAVGGCAGGPVRNAEAEDLLIGTALDARAVAAAGDCIVAALDPVDDVRASADYRRLVVPRLLRRALAEATTPFGLAA
ncbi:MAG: xanthine dehydrogenase family protein subunit M [Alphaproteobacteria bacterium]